jgi:hypothetical protein
MSSKQSELRKANSECAKVESKLRASKAKWGLGPDPAVVLPIHVAHSELVAVFLEKYPKWKRFRQQLINRHPTGAMHCLHPEAWERLQREPIGKLA